MNIASKKVRVAVIGTRGQAIRIAVPTIQNSAHATLVGMLGSNYARTKETALGLGVRAFESVDEVISSGEVDAVWVTVPNNLHATVATQFLRGHTNVLLEKPMATSVEQAIEIAQAAQQSNAVLKIAYQHRFREPHQKLRTYLEEERFGELGHLRLHRYWKFPYFPNQDPSELSEWRKSPEESGGFAINDIGSHLVDLMSWLIPDPLQLVDARFTRRYPNVRNDSTAFLSLRAGASTLVSIETSNVLESPGSLLEIYGEKGWARSVDSFHDHAITDTSFGEKQEVTSTGMQAYLGMLNDFIGACNGFDSIGATAEDGISSVALVESARREGRYLEDL